MNLCENKQTNVFGNEFGIFWKLGYKEGKKKGGNTV
jgi:hypothetical protein